MEMRISHYYKKIRTCEHLQALKQILTEKVPCESTCDLKGTLYFLTN